MTLMSSQLQLTWSTWVHPRILVRVRVTRSLVLCVCFVDRCLFFCHFSFGHCVVCSSSINGFWLPFDIFKLFLAYTPTCWYLLGFFLFFVFLLFFVFFNQIQFRPQWFYPYLVMLLNTPFNSISFISWRSALLVEETGVPGE